MFCIMLRNKIVFAVIFILAFLKSVDANEWQCYIAQDNNPRNKRCIYVEYEHNGEKNKVKLLALDFANKKQFEGIWCFYLSNLNVRELELCENYAITTIQKNKQKDKYYDKHRVARDLCKVFAKTVEYFKSMKWLIAYIECVNSLKDQINNNKDLQIFYIGGYTLKKYNESDTHKIGSYTIDKSKVRIFQCSVEAIEFAIKQLGFQVYNDNQVTCQFSGNYDCDQQYWLQQSRAYMHLYVLNKNANEQCIKNITENIIENLPLDGDYEEQKNSELAKKQMIFQHMIFQSFEFEMNNLNKNAQSERSKPNRTKSTRGCCFYDVRNNSYCD